MTRTRLLVLLGVVALGITVWLLGERHLSVDALSEQEQRLRAFLAADPVSAWLIGFVVYTLVSLFPGTSGKSILCGWLYGFWQSLLMVTVSLTIAAVAGFSVSRFVLREGVQNRLGKAVDLLDGKLREHGVFTMLTVRMLHVPYTLVNYVAGATRLPLLTFAWTTCVGLVPSTAIFVGLGDGLPTLDQVREHGAKELLSWPLMVALVLMGAFPWLTRAIVRKLRPGLASSADALRSVED